MPTMQELEAQVADLTSQIAPLKESDTKLKSLMQQRDLSRLERDPAERAEGAWEEGDDNITIVQGGDYVNGARLERRVSRKKAMRELTKNGYRPYSEFKSFADLIRFGVENRNDRGKIESRVGSHLKAIQGMGTTDGSDGGFTIMPEFSFKILERMYDNNLWDLTDQYTVGGNGMTFLASAETSRANGSRAGGMQGYWVAEGGTMTKSKPTMREVNLKLGKIAIVVYLTDELLKDSSLALEQRVVKLASDEFKFLRGDALINGSGTGGIPLGLLNSPHLVQIAAEQGQDARTINTMNIQNMYSRLFAPNLDRVRWLIHQDTQPQLNTMTLGLGLGQVPVFQPPGQMSAAPYGTLMGRPIQPTEFNATLGTTGDIIAADMSQILSISKGGIDQAVSMHVEFLTDQLALRFTMRCAARPWENTPLTPYKGTNTQSSAISLATR